MSNNERPVIIFLITMFFFLAIVLLNNKKQTLKKEKVRPNVEIFNKWSSCIKERALNETDHRAFWTKFQSWTEDCDKRADIDKLGLIPLRNVDEVKFGLLPVEEERGTANTLVTIGIGKDIGAELHYELEMNKIGQNLTFYGADPITDVNAELYAKIGKYFPFAVGGEAGFSQASVYINGTYVNRDVVHVDLVYFFDKILKIKTYDNIWLDAEGAEWALADIFYKDGRLDRRGLSFCQMSLEMHQPNEQQLIQFMTMIKTIVEEGRYGMHRNVNVGHMRMFLFNFADEYCVKKFLARQLYKEL